MEVLQWIATWRNPVLDAIFSGITYLGSELGLIAVGLFFFWCVGKKEGYYMLFVGFTGTVLNQFFKLFFRVERPWVLDPDFQPVASAVPDATGYSFPSGHTQSSVGLFGCILLTARQRAVRLFCFLPMLLVPFSRLYLGVHTPADVFFSFGLAILLVLAFRFLIDWAWDRPHRMAILFAATITLSVAYLLYVLLYPFPLGTDGPNLLSGRKNAYTLLGALCGMALVYFLDRRYIHFDTRATWPGQVLKLVLGAALVLVLKAGLKAPLAALVGADVQNALRYFLLVLFAGAVWPLAFPLFQRIGKKKS